MRHVLALVCLLLVLAPPTRSAARGGDAGLCAAAAAAAERERGLPQDMLYAVALTESARWDPALQRGYAWPWTVRAGPDAFRLDTKAEALATVRRLKAEGRRNIDVGCAQINLMYHPDAFADLAAGFDPLTNLRYAARFLRDLHGQTGDWQAAIARYHSADPDRGTAYRAKVLAHWRDLGERPAPPPVVAAAGPGGIGRGGLAVAPGAPPPRVVYGARSPAAAPGAVAVLRPSGLDAGGIRAFFAAPRAPIGQK